jgi:Protein of unknown function (DUF1488)
MPLWLDPSLEFIIDRFDGVRFTMLDKTKRVVCRVSLEALQDRAARDRTDQTDLGGIFETYRSRIESVASKRYDWGELSPFVRSGDF